MSANQWTPIKLPLSFPHASRSVVASGNNSIVKVLRGFWDGYNKTHISIKPTEATNVEWMVVGY